MSWDSRALSICTGLVGSVVNLGGALCKTVSVAVVPAELVSSSLAFRFRVMGVVTLVDVGQKRIKL